MLAPCPLIFFNALSTRACSFFNKLLCDSASFKRALFLNAVVGISNADIESADSSSNIFCHSIYRDKIDLWACSQLAKGGALKLVGALNLVAADLRFFILDIKSK